MGEVSITKYVDVQITRETKVITEAGFGTPLILAELSNFSSAERVRVYEDLTGVAEDFDVTSYIYKAAQKEFGQELAPESIKVGRKDANVNEKQRIKFDAAGTAGSFKIKWGAEETASIAYDANVATIKAAIEALSFTAVTVTEIVAAKEWTIEFTGADGNKAQVTPTVTLLPTSVTTATVTVDQYGSAVQTYVEAINDVVEVDDDWYFLHCETKTKADILLIAADIEARKKIYAYNTEDADAITNAGTDVGTALKLLGYTRSIGCYNSEAGHLFAEALVGRLAPEDPGTETWFGKSLTGVRQETGSTLNATQRTNAQNHNLNLHLRVGGVAFTDAGIVADGTFIDLVRLTDFLESRIAESVFRLMATLKKIPYTTRGIGLVDGAMRTVLEAAFNKEKLAEYETSVPLKSSIPVNQVAARVLPDMNFTATVTGAVHKVIIRGKLSV